MYVHGPPRITIIKLYGDPVHFHDLHRPLYMYIQFRPFRE